MGKMEGVEVGHASSRWVPGMVIGTISVCLVAIIQRLSFGNTNKRRYQDHSKFAALTSCCLLLQQTPKASSLHSGM